MIVELIVTRGPHSGRTFRFLDHSTFIVGRSANVHFSLPEKDPHLSRHHAVIEVNPPLCRLLHLSETNPTLLNGTAVSQADLRDGDRLTLGQTELVVKIVAGDSEDDAATVSLPDSLRPEPKVPEQNFTQPLARSVARATTASAKPDGPPTIPGYRIETELGRGGMGIVYRAVHTESGESVALKMILPSGTVTTTALTRFIREADVVRRLEHPGIVKFRDSGVANARVWFAMEYVPGSNVLEMCKSTGAPAIGRAVGWMAQALDALSHAHERGFVHRDIKPENLLIGGSPGAEVVKLADFGLAKSYEASPLSGLTMSGQVSGTLAYMPPEQILDMRSVKPAADQYAVAASLYRLLTGQHLYPDVINQQSLLLKILGEDPVRIETRRPDVPAKLADAIHRALQRDPAARFADCRAFAKGLRGAIGK